LLFFIWCSAIIDHYAKAVLKFVKLNTVAQQREAFEPEVARALVKRLEFCYTSKHGSWLNVAENELSALTRQCVSKKRFETIEKLKDETNSWTENCNKKQKGIIWQFNVENARIKLHSLYPKS
jgi:recombinational DNA repair ATPase RecF